MSQIQIAHDGTGYRCYWTTNGIDREYFGPRWALPRQAIAYSNLSTGFDRVSPLRSPAESSPALALPPVSSGPGVDDSAGARIDATSGPGA